MDRFRALEVFIEVAESGGLAAAARRLSLSAPSVTRVLNELEEDLGVLLLHRTTRAVTLSEPGRAFLETARRIVHDYQEARDAARGARRAPKGVLRLTSSVLFGRHYVTPIVLDYLGRYPDVVVDAVYLDRVVNLVEEGFDVAVRIGPLPDSSMMATRVGEVRRVVCGCPSYFRSEGVPQTPNDLAGHRIIAARAVTQGDVWRFADNQSVHVTPRVSFSSAPDAIAAARTGWGLTRVLSYQIGPELDNGGLQTVLSAFEPAPAPIHIIHPEGRLASAKVRAFVDLARERLRGHAHLNQ